MSEPDADHHRYRALLRDADDERKRLALIQLLIDERARDKLAAQLKPAKPELLPEHQPFVPLAPMHRGVPQKAVENRRWSGEINSAAAGAFSIGLTHLAAPPAELEPPALAQERSQPNPYNERTEPPPQNVVTTLDTAIGGPVALIASEPSRPDDPAVRVAQSMSSGAASAAAGPITTTASSSGAPPAATDIEIASRIQAALTELTGVHRPQVGFEKLDRLPAPSEAASPDAKRSVTVVGASTNDLVARFVRLMSKGLALPAATIPSTPVAPPSEDDEENSIALQIQAALAKQKRDGQ